MDVAKSAIAGHTTFDMYGTHLVRAVITGRGVIATDTFLAPLALREQGLTVDLTALRALV